jgi:hypothetical protein
MQLIWSDKGDIDIAFVSNTNSLSPTAMLSVHWASRLFDPFFNNASP